MSVCGYCAYRGGFWLDKHPSAKAGAAPRVLWSALLLQTGFAINIVLVVSRRGWRSSLSSGTAELQQVVLLTVMFNLSRSTCLGWGWWAWPCAAGAAWSGARRAEGGGCPTETALPITWRQEPLFKLCCPQAHTWTTYLTVSAWDSSSCALMKMRCCVC